MSDHRRRRVLYVVTGCAWLGVGHFAAMSIKMGPDDASQRTWLWVVLAIASCLFTASLLVCMFPSQDRAYRTGYSDGQKVSGCSMFRPVLTPVNGSYGSNVLPIRRLHTDN